MAILLNGCNSMLSVINVCKNHWVAKLNLIEFVFKQKYMEIILISFLYVKEFNKDSHPCMYNGTYILYVYMLWG